MTETLDGIPTGARVVIDAVDGPLGTRLAELGLLPGAEVEVVQAIPLGGPLVLDRGGFLVALRRDDARLIRIRGGGA